MDNFIQGKWCLTDLYESENAFDLEQQTLEQLTTAFEQYREKLNQTVSGELFREMLSAIEQISAICYKRLSYCELLFAANTQDSGNITRMAMTQAAITEISNRTLFFNLWWKSLEDSEASRLAAFTPESEYYLHAARLSRPHTLSEAEEKIICIKDTTGSEALNNLYDSITNRYRFELEIDGEKKQMTRGELMTYARSENRAYRENAYKELYRVYGEDGSILGQIYQAICRDWSQECICLRKYHHQIDVRNLGNDIPNDVVNLLLETCRKNRDLFIEYFRLKKKILGLDELHRFDLYAPLKEDDKHYDYDTGMKIVLDAYRGFDPAFAEMAERVYKKEHIDSEVRHGKRGGAFCLTAGPDLTPWVLTNYQNKLDDVSTLAHELGHAIHSMSAEDQNIFQQEACLPLAETASTFGEMILADYFEQKENDPKVICSMLMKQLDDNYATIQRQAYFALFEIKAHQMIMEGADIDALNEAYLDNLREQFGDAMVIDDYFKWEWVSIPHIFSTPFYVYAYAFGQLLVLSLYQQYKQEGASFVPKYKEMLHKGGSEEPKMLLKDAGFDFRSESFWQGGFDCLREKLERIKTLILE